MLGYNKDYTALVLNYMLKNSKEIILVSKKDIKTIIFKGIDE